MFSCSSTPNRTSMRHLAELGGLYMWHSKMNDFSMCNTSHIAYVWSCSRSVLLWLLMGFRNLDQDTPSPSMFPVPLMQLEAIHHNSTIAHRTVESCFTVTKDTGHSLHSHIYLYTYIVWFVVICACLCSVCVYIYIQYLYTCCNA